jgi:octaprenyl-diphosphate synthase
MNSVDSHSLSLFQAPIREELDILDKDFREILHSDIPLIREICSELAGTPGKRIRPSILFLSSRSAGGDPGKAAVAGLAVELTHTATLIHDDILDNHKIRRGRPTIYARYGEKTATIMGDFLYSMAFSRLGEAGLDEVMEVLARVTHLMSIGEIIQLQHRRDLDISEAGYMELIYSKTASLFSAASECGALMSEKLNGQRNNYSKFGENIGLAFQITDDLFDYIADGTEIGKPVASDFSEGRVTLPFITALKNAPDKKKKHVSDLFRNGLDKGKQWKEVVSFVRNYGGVEYSYNKAIELGEKAKNYLSGISPSRERDALCYAADYVVQRIRPLAV